MSDVVEYEYLFASQLMQLKKKSITAAYSKTRQNVFT